ncbi:gamma-glutamyltransferase [soil metagenome]
MRTILFASLTLLATVALGAAQDSAAAGDAGRITPVQGRDGMVVAQERAAAEVGAAILREGGNAVDAAVAVACALAVTYPQAGNLGGGGFMVVHMAEAGQSFALDFREMAPGAATRDMFLDEDGNPDAALSRRSILSAGTPGSVAGLAFARDQWGTLPLARLVEPALRMAEDGITVSAPLSSSLESARGGLHRSPAAMEAFFGQDGRDGQAPAPGSTLRQPDLAWSLRAIAESGHDAFYRGAVGAKIVAFMQEAGGLITDADLEAYQPVLRDPVAGGYRGTEVVSMPPPSAGGTLLVQMLGILGRHDVAALGHGSPSQIHLFAEVMKRAYADRAQYFGDPDFVDVPVARLLSDAHLEALGASISPDAATPAESLGDASLRPAGESTETTHFSVIDSHGNAVACTTTLNFSYGSRIMVPGTGILLNNEMDDFAAKPGSPNAFGALGGEANAVAPRKRMLSSMTPTIVLKDGKPWMVTGAPGGTRITTAVLQAITNTLDFGMDAAGAIEAPRIHHQWYPDTLFLEEGISPESMAALRALGHEIGSRSAIGRVQTAAWDGTGTFSGYSDPRSPGGAAVPVSP